MPTENDDTIDIRSSQEVRGLGGADVFNWYRGSAKIYGGDTGEHYETDYYGDKTGGDRLYVMRNSAASVRFTSTEDGSVKTGGETLTFTGIERIHLGDGNDIINASKADVLRYGLTLYANGGNDKITGSSGNDFIDPGAGDDVVRGGAGHDFIQGSTGDDRIYGGKGDDNIRWGRGDPTEVIGNDKMYGGKGGWDLINVWMKDGWLNSNGVVVKIQSVAADGSMKGSSETDAGGGHSTLKFSGFEQGWTHEGKDVVNAENANIKGTHGIQWSTRAGDDIVIGSRGNDVIEGGDGRDTITGGRGDDILVANTDWWDPTAPGDGDRDVLIFHKGDGKDQVWAFDVGIDRLNVDGRDYTIKVTDQGTKIDLGDGDTILVRNVWETDLLIS